MHNDIVVTGHKVLAFEDAGFVVRKARKRAVLGQYLTFTCPGTKTVSALSTLKRRNSAVDSSKLVSLSVNLLETKLGMFLSGTQPPHCLA